jgi:ABC-type transporter MlaC component
MSFASDFTAEGATTKIIDSAISALIDLRENNLLTEDTVRNLIEREIMPNLSLDMSLTKVLRKNVKELTLKQKTLFKIYLKNSIIRDYGAILTGYDIGPGYKLNTKTIKDKGNRVLTEIKIDDISIRLSLIKENSNWKIYDLYFSGVSLMNNYGYYFKSYIRRKGLDSLLKKIEKPIKL